MLSHIYDNEWLAHTLHIRIQQQVLTVRPGRQVK